MSNRLYGYCFALVLLGAPALTVESIPPWLQQAAAASAPAYSKKAPAVVLLDESRTTINDDGRITTTKCYAVRILSPEGRGAAVAKEIYLTDTGKVRDMRAWLIRPSGEIKKYGKDNTLDVAAVTDDVYNEVRAKVIVASDDAEVGAIFGYEVTSEDRSVFSQFEWQFQGQLPTLVSRCAYTLPKGWRAESVTFNRARIEPTVTGSTYTWELQDLPYIEDEPASPALTNIVPRLAVNVYPPTGAKPEMIKTFNDWASVSRWLSGLSDPQTGLNDAMVAKARELTANARTEFERIQAIARFAQSVHYISIQTGIGRGGGYRPHSATEVFSRLYGDCKDKATLMRAMLKAVGITAYPVAIFSGDPTYVREEWPSPQQFNHCVIAVKVSEETQALTIVKHPSLGRLLIFDPTDNDTPIGDLPDHEQGSLALVVAGDAGALLRMPTTPPEANRLERQTEVTLTPSGSITAVVQERATGQAAVYFRNEFRQLSPSKYRAMIEGWIARSVTGARVSMISPSDHPTDSRFTLDVEFTAANYAQIMQKRFLVFKPVIVSRRESLFLTESSRKYPVVLESQAYTETTRIKLPTEFEVDELPESLKLDESFGRYAATYELKNGYLILTRAFELRATTIPVEQYTTVRRFFERIRTAEQTHAIVTACVPKLLR